MLEHYMTVLNQARADLNYFSSISDEKTGEYRGIGEVNQKNFTEKVLNNKRLVVVLSGTKWSPHTKKIEKVFSARLKNLENTKDQQKYDIFVLDVEENSKIAEKLGITNIPSLTFFLDGRRIRQTEQLDFYYFGNRLATRGAEEALKDLDYVADFLSEIDMNYFEI